MSLNPQIQDIVASMAAGRPFNTDPDAWYSMAWTVEFSVLPIYDAVRTDESEESVKAVQPAMVTLMKSKFRPCWERRLPARLVVATLGEANDTTCRSLNLKVSVETTDTGVVKSLSALLDSGATSRFIDRDYVKANGMTTRTLSTPIPVCNTNGTGTITEVIDLILRYQNHSERTLFAVTGLGSQNLILGHSWLQKHNPKIDWATGDVKMSRCPGNCCSGCHDEIKEEWKVKKAEVRGVAACMEGDLPELIQDDDEEDKNEDDLEFEEGDPLFATGLNGPPEEVRPLRLSLKG